MEKNLCNGDEYWSFFAHEKVPSLQRQMGIHFWRIQKDFWPYFKNESKWKPLCYEPKGQDFTPFATIF